MAIGFGDPDNECKKLPAFLCSLFAPAESRFMAAVRGRPSGLPVTRFRFANPRTAATLSFGDD